MSTTTEVQYQLKVEVATLIQTLSHELPIDQAVKDALPPGTRALSAHKFGESAWSFTAKIEAVDSEGKPTPYFLKYVPGEMGMEQLRGEFLGMQGLHKAAPNFVPKPIGWGKLRDVVPSSHFLVVEYKEFTQGMLPDPIRLGLRVAEMHQSPESKSPTGMFGFPVQTYDGARLQAVAWDKSWTSFFSKLLDKAYVQDVETNGVWDELEAAYRRVQSHLIPRLIGALEEDGRVVEPVLIHGDMWDGNVGTEAGTGDPWIYDCAAYYGHNEMELGIWRAERHQLRAKVYRSEYLRNCDPSEPEEEWDDRNRLYSAKTNFMHSACFHGSPSRQQVFDDFKYLLEKYEIEEDARDEATAELPVVDQEQTGVVDAVKEEGEAKPAGIPTIDQEPTAVVDEVKKTDEGSTDLPALEGDEKSFVSDVKESDGADEQVKNIPEVKEIPVSG